MSTCQHTCNQQRSQYKLKQFCKKASAEQWNFRKEKQMHYAICPYTLYSVIAQLLALFQTGKPMKESDERDKRQLASRSRPFMLCMWFWKGTIVWLFDISIKFDKVRANSNIHEASHLVPLSPCQWVCSASANGCHLEALNESFNVGRGSTLEKS